MLLPAATRLHHHVLILLVHHIVGGVYVEDADWGEFCGDTTGGWCRPRVHGVDQSLNDGVVGGFEMRSDREVADAVAVICVVLQRRNDPVVPAHLLEVHMQVFPVAARLRLHYLVLGEGVQLLQRLLTPPCRRSSAHSSLGEQIFIDGLVVVTRSSFDLVVEEVALLASAKRQEESLFLVGPAGSGESQSTQVHGPTAPVLQGLQFKAQLLGQLVLLGSETLEDFPHIKNFPLAAESTDQVLRGLYLEQSRLLFT